MRLIDADAFASEMKRRQDAAGKWLREAKDHETATRADAVLSFIYEVKLTLDKMPIVDAVPVVRCKDCKYSEHWYGDRNRCFLWAEDGIGVFEDGYCSYGERKGGDE